ncbi:hypothetical protein [Massilioclostridium coli]|uniref:hypothetical protein n=1 Tax=Massilioclostridium coli TaxID=1870991 RepID=UPI0022E6C0A9|nr:hypothetical protein [Massilioclostridium coli]
MTQTQKTPLGRKIGRFLFLVLIHMLLSLPFKVMIMIPGFTDIRPVTCLQPIFGLFFGQTGALAFAVGNLISDVLSDSLQWSCIAGFIANYLYVVMVYKLWHMIRKKAFSLRDSHDFLAYIAIILISAVVLTVMISFGVYAVQPEVDLVTLIGTIFCNNTIFPIILGAPIMIIMQEEFHLLDLWTRRKKEESADGDSPAEK